MRLGANHTPAPAPIRPLAERAQLHLMKPNPADWFRAIPADGDPRANDRFGDCWPLARRWCIALRRATAAGDTTPPAVADVLADYATLTGFDPATGQPDDGTDTSAGMTAWITKGVRVNDQTLDIPHWVTVDPTNDAHVALAIDCAGPLMATWRLPMAMQDPAVWSQAPGTGTDWTTVWGEHEVCLAATDGEALCWVRTWGNDLEVHPDIRRRFMIGVDVPLDLSVGGWLQTTGLTPMGLDYAALRADVAGFVG